MGMKADDRNVIPLCFRHHHSLHTQYGSEPSFFAHYAEDEDYGKKLSESLWSESAFSKE